jgi:hypothetical protein
MSLGQIGQFNMEHCNFLQMEQLASILHALTNVCKQGDEAGTHDVLFALLERDTMYMEAMAIRFFATPFLGPAEVFVEDNGRGFDECSFGQQPTKLTPNQDQSAYIQCMKEVTLQLMKEMANYKLGQAFFAAMRDCQLFYFVTQRLMRLVAQEALETRMAGPSERPHGWFSNMLLLLSTQNNNRGASKRFPKMQPLIFCPMHHIMYSQRQNL